MHRTLVALATTLACLIVAPSAFAWNGAQWSKNTCGADLTAHAANGSWWIRVSDESGTLAEASYIPAKAYTDTVPLTVGGFSHDGGYHLVKYEAANAANHADGYVSYTQPQWNCTGGRGPAGPPGPKGDPGVGYDCTGTAVPTGGTPAMCPGTPGKDNNSSTSQTTTIIIREAPKVCTSSRKYAFRVRKTYMGQRVTRVKASEPGIKVKVRRSRDRIVVSWSTKGKKYTPGGVVRSMRVLATLANGKHVRLQWLYRPCASPDGQLNDPSAAGQGTGGGTSNAAVL